ncbi:hypothetical protein V6N12_007804 [Hibiscus sabdariffa]|uniref:Secreted protein n=1 Tax=Hibiscus sabdariffa TaxID=183260 RepID=A0ABR2F2U6_9ROSI
MDILILFLVFALLILLLGFLLVGEPSVVGAVKECVVGEGSAGHNDVIVDEQLDLPCDQFVQDGSHLREVYVDPGGLASTDVQGVSIVLAPELIVGSDVI